jgi:hypothetical protein
MSCPVEASMPQRLNTYPEGDFIGTRGNVEIVWEGVRRSQNQSVRRTTARVAMTVHLAGLVPSKVPASRERAARGRLRSLQGLPT